MTKKQEYLRANLESRFCEVARRRHASSETVLLAAVTEALLSYGGVIVALLWLPEDDEAFVECCRSLWDKLTLLVNDHGAEWQRKIEAEWQRKSDEQERSGDDPSCKHSDD